MLSIKKRKEKKEDGSEKQLSEYYTVVQI